ncbi:peptide N-acetyl-beta-D-glucosaminyl asparaginase amidase A-domain-containing protein [Roridomyces roridus]|uniref:Peptide N-acetyl-beta-D-glucosaminyl asparaginase amidase A-domain-containing protein n=1 Tax=Roridomyces roridus TaxID=1738132 RepID=A0AAD7BWW3_9AGAR|nr:peptide N-acetyl-beta-D-glucosaminyl asparaginase amidase A-domain-containing protein [Roridomyces roridus]
MLWILTALFLAAQAQAAVLVDFQVAQPPIVPHDAKQCTVQILQHDFADFTADVVEFTPPTDCGTPGSWAAITLNFTVTSNGTQFDRLGIFTFQNVEIWRTSTPEPTAGGIIWTYIKDVSRYTPLFAEAGTFILELDNLIETGLNGVYSATLDATFFASSPEHPPAKQANAIIPLSTHSNTTGNDASVPPGFSMNVTLPQNTVEIYAEKIYPSGNSNEEFWYFNIANEFSSEFGITTPQQGPFREVRLLVDGMVAGVAFPYPVIFTGGILPPAWRPITSYGALDLPTYFLDLTPFVPILTDGLPHNFTIDVASAEAGRAISNNWFVSGVLQVVTDPSGKPTTGRIISHNADPFAVASTTGSSDATSVNITVTASRKISITSEIISGSGKKNEVVFTQDLDYINQQNYLDNTLIQNVFQSSSGSILSTHNNVPVVKDTFSFPITINITAFNVQQTNFATTFDHSYNRDLLPSPLILGSTINERQISGGFFQEASTGNTGNGTSNNTFSYVDPAGNTFNRQVNAAFNNITLDIVSGTLSGSQELDFPLGADDVFVLH